MFKRRKRRKHDPDVSVDLPITPMLDMAFQLMAFFVFTFRPTPQEGQIAMKMPASEGGGALTTFAPEELEPPEEIRIQVTDSNGQVDSITFIGGADANGERLAADDPRSVLEKLKSIPNLDDKKVKIKIESTDKLKYSELIRLMDQCIKAGFSSVGVAKLSDS